MVSGVQSCEHDLTVPGFSLTLFCRNSRSSIRLTNRTNPDRVVPAHCLRNACRINMNNARADKYLLAQEVFRDMRIASVAESFDVVLFHATGRQRVHCSGITICMEEDFCEEQIDGG